MYFGILDWNLWFCDLKCSPQSCSSNFVSATLYGGRDDVWWRNVGLVAHVESSIVLHKKLLSSRRWPGYVLLRRRSFGGVEQKG